MQGFDPETMTHFIKLLLTNTVQEMTMSCGQSQSDCGCGCSGQSYDLFAPLQLGLNGLGSGLGDITDERCGKGCVVYWRGEINPGWWFGGSENEQNAFLNRIEVRIKSVGGPLVSGVNASAQSVHRGSIFGTTYQKIIDSFITVQMGTEAGIYLVKQLIEDAITAEGASYSAVNVQIANNPSGVGPPAVDPDDFYHPKYDYPADYVPKVPSLNELFENLTPDPTSGISLATIALIAGGAFVAYRAFVR